MKPTALKHIFIAACLLTAAICRAEVVLPHILGSNMVLKQKAKANLWGTATAGSKVSITTSWDGKTYTAHAGANGKWKQAVKTPAAGGPYTITFNDGTKTVMDNILIGEVWVCSGQSNMAMPLKGRPSDPTLNSEELIAQSANNNIRLFTVGLEGADAPKDDCSGEWQAATPQTTPDFSAVAFQFAQVLQKQLGIPIGLVHTSWGGTSIRLWMSDSYDAFAALYPEPPPPPKRAAVQANPRPTQPKALYNAMIAPVTPLTISGFLWYQGEADRAVAPLYRNMLPAMAKEWRAKWGQGNIPFYYVQIAPWLYGGDKVSLSKQSMYLREAQLEALQDIPNAAMAVTADVGSDKTIHPPDKTTVANRLAAAALALTYGKPVPYHAPELSKAKAAGGRMVLTFKYAGTGLVLKPGDNNFEIAGDDKVFHAATAVVKGNVVELSSAEVPEPVAARYGFRNYFMGTLYNADGFPASSFRTDKWVDVK